MTEAQTITVTDWTSENDLAKQIVSAVKLNRDGSERKKKVHGDTRTLCGADALNKKCNIVIKDIASVQTYNERVDMMVAAGICKTAREAREMLKNTSGLADTLQLRKMIRLSVMRAEICTDAITLVQIAQFIATKISAGNEITTREKLKNQASAEAEEV